MITRTELKVKLRLTAIAVFTLFIFTLNTDQAFCQTQKKDTSADTLDSFPSFRGHSMPEFAKWLRKEVLLFASTKRDVPSSAVALNFTVSRHGSGLYPYIISTNDQQMGDDLLWIFKIIDQDWDPVKKDGVKIGTNHEFNFRFDPIKHVTSFDKKGNSVMTIFPSKYDSHKNNLLYKKYQPATFGEDKSASFNKYIGGKLDYSVAEKTGTRADIVVAFTVDYLGKICDISFMGQEDDALCAQVKAIMENAPSWKPARCKGKPANSRQYTVIAGVDNKNYKSSNVVEKMPEYPGGVKAMGHYLNSNIRYPTEAINNNISGRSVVRFVVAEDGSIEDLQIMISANPLLDLEAIRLVSSMPKWIPGEIDGKPTPVWFALPVVFSLYEGPITKPLPNPASIRR